MFIHGKGGTDTVHIDGLRDDFSLSKLFGKVQITSSFGNQTLEDVEFVSFEDQQVDLSQLQDSSSIGEIHKIEAFQKVGGGNTTGFITANGRYIIEKPFGEDEHLYRRDLESGDRVLIDADANGIPSTGDSQQALGASADGRYILFKLDEYGDVDLTPGDAYSLARSIEKDIQTGEILRVDALSDGSTFSANWGVNNAAISLDGQVVVFEVMTPDFVVIPIQFLAVKATSIKKSDNWRIKTR